MFEFYLKKACQITQHAKSELTEGNFLLFQECTNCLKNDFNFGELISRGFLLFWRKKDDLQKLIFIILYT